MKRRRSWPASPGRPEPRRPGQVTSGNSSAAVCVGVRQYQLGFEGHICCPHPKGMVTTLVTQRTITGHLCKSPT